MGIRTTITALAAGVHVSHRKQGPTKLEKHASSMNDLKKDLKPLTFWEVIGSTCAAAFGVQSYKNRQRDFTRGNIVAFITSGVLFTMGFVLAVVIVVNQVIS